ncbi:unnamed protein product [Rotaria magnacalcarata]|uniref:Uncharacterized protein n=1 Tax=Rotaria magnacalcarata TaxID=392030 RepID=A0A815VB66_9BILA|nr:unnamed protein product [Rotaria magnacalcarata]
MVFIILFNISFNGYTCIVSNNNIIFNKKKTLRQMLGWIFLHEQFIGNKIIAHILALSALLLLSHDNGFRFNRFLLEHVFFGHLFYFFITELEPMFIHNFDSSIIIITLICALLFNMLTITIPFQYTSFANAASFIVAIPCITLIDRYLLNIKYSALFILAILCSLSSILLSMIPKTCFQAGEARKMKQALGLINKDLNISAAAVGGLLSTGGTTDGTSSTFEEIKTQRRIRNALLYNELKT